MKSEEIRLFLNKRIRIFLIGNICYTGHIQTINEDSILIKDKFQNDILLNISDIQQIISIGGI